MDRNENRKVVFGAFKGIGDMLNAAPTIGAELARGTGVVLLTFPQAELRALVDLIDFGTDRGALTIESLPVGGGLARLRDFLRTMASLSPDLIWISPHAPRTVASWKIPLLMWFTKQLYWRRAKLAGAETEKLSRLFDIRVPVDRQLPYELREWVAYSIATDRLPAGQPRPISFRRDLLPRAHEKPLYDVLIHPGASTENRRWPASYHAELIAKLPSEYRVAFLGLPGEMAAVKSALPPDSRVSFVSGTLRDAIAAIARARVALTMDSSSLHFARLLRVPTVTLFGASNPKSVVSPSDTIRPLVASGLACRPCESKQCRYSTVLCMRMIEPSLVAETVQQLLRMA